jgi:lipopolysaccharide/colanic/teichoic acid biosynthesis glycosyltransferase
MNWYRSFGKRALDMVIAGTALLILSPVLLVLAILIGAKLGRPVLFVQERSGRHGQPFRIVKFRSMLNAVGRYQGVPDEERLTPFGNWLRSSSLDELPALWNVLKGDMSLVGPRPLHRRYDPLYSPEQARRLEARPGITGWAQVNGRNAISWPDRFRLDVDYVERQSLWFDLRILFATARAVFLRQGIGPAGGDIMPEFRGERD